MEGNENIKICSDKCKSWTSAPFLESLLIHMTMISLRKFVRLISFQIYRLEKKTDITCKFADYQKLGFGTQIHITYACIRTIKNQQSQFTQFCKFNEM